MSFFHNHISLFYIIPFSIGTIVYLLAYFLQVSILLIVSLILLMIGLVIFSYGNWRKVFSIYFDFIYVSPKEKYEIKARILQDENFAEEYELERAYKKKFYLKSLLGAIFLAVCSLIIFIVMIINLINILF